MSYYGSSCAISSECSTPSTSPTMSTKARPMAIPARAGSSTSSNTSSGSASNWNHRSATSSHRVPYFSSTIRKQSFGQASAYISDQDLFGSDMDTPFLREPPPPPRSAEFWLAQPNFLPRDRAHVMPTRVSTQMPTATRQRTKSDGSVRGKKAMKKPAAFFSD